jgi:hypothetical protein
MRHQNDALKNNMTPRQKETLLKFKRKLAESLPKVRIEWAKAYNKDIIELHLEYDKYNYRNSIKAATVATAVEDETDITIILR